jgi:hypothetical protein
MTKKKAIENKPNYYLTHEEIDIISLALRDRILLLKGKILIEEDLSKNDIVLARLNLELREAERVQIATTYEGQPSIYKLSEVIW